MTRRIYIRRGSSESLAGSALDSMHEPLFVISIVSEMLDVHPQTLRVYEREGLVTPGRRGGQRMYSRADIERLALILDLTRNLGVNRAGVDIILRMRHRLESLHREAEEMLESIEDERRGAFRKRIENILSEED